MMKNVKLPRWKTGCVLLAGILLLPRAAAAQTGSVEGTVRFEGAAPTPRTLEVNKNPEVCGTSISATDLLVEGGRVAYAVAWVEGLEGDPGEGEFVLSNSGCMFDPPVMAAAAGGTLVVNNQDDVLHNTHLNFIRGSASRTVGNWALSRQGAEISEDRPLRRAGLIEVECDAHSWMHAVIRVFDHPYFAVSDASGAFRLELPAGTHTVKVWHSVLGEREQEVTVSADGAVSAEFVFSSADLSEGEGGGR